MDNLRVFSNKELGGIRVLDRDGEPWFVGKDVAGILGYGSGNKNSKALNNAVNDHVDAEDKGVTKLDTPGGKQNIVIINESGLYSLIMNSKLPQAKEFKRWVTSEVLPSIRKTGSYVKGNDMDILIQTIVAQTTAAIMAQIPLIISETVKATVTALGCGDADESASRKKGKKRGKNLFIHSKVDRLPQDIRNRVIRMMFSEGITCVQISDMLKDAGHSISKSSIDRHRHRVLTESMATPFIELS